MEIYPGELLGNGIVGDSVVVCRIKTKMETKQRKLRQNECGQLLIVRRITRVCGIPFCFSGEVSSGTNYI